MFVPQLSLSGPGLAGAGWLWTTGLILAGVLVLRALVIAILSRPHRRR